MNTSSPLTNDSTFSTLYNFVQSIFNLGDRIILISLGGIQVSLNVFLICIAVFGIVFASLLSFARSYTGNISSMAAADVRGSISSARRFRRWFNSDSNATLSSMFD